MHITELEAVPFRLPRRADVRWAGLEMGIGNFVLVRLHTDEGPVGLGEINPLPDWGGDHGRQGGETQASVCALMNEILAPAIIGLDPLTRTDVHTAMNRVLQGHPYIKAAIDIALHDLMGKATGQPLHALLGGAARPGVVLSHMLGLMDVEAALHEARSAVEEGVRAFQIKGGIDAERDATLVRKLRKEFGADVVLRLDLNATKRTAKAAAAILSDVMNLLDYVEQPVAGLTEMARATHQFSVQVIADESCWSAHDAAEIVRRRGADALSIYLAKAGGVTGAMHIDVVASLAGMSCDINGGFESGVGNAANVHVGMAGRSIDLPCVISATAPSGSMTSDVAGRYYHDDIVAEPFGYCDGVLTPPSGPGLGVTIDEDRLSAYRCD